MFHIQYSNAIFRKQSLTDLEHILTLKSRQTKPKTSNKIKPKFSMGTQYRILLISYKAIKNSTVFNGQFLQLHMAAAVELDKQLRNFITTMNDNIFNHNRNMFVLRYRGVNDVQMDYLLAHNSNDIKRFFITNQGLSHFGIKQISRPRWENLIIIQMSNNNIGPKGCKYVSMGQWPKLEEIILAKNKLGSEGVAHLCKGVWKTLKLLVLNDNLIDDEGVRQLLKANWEQISLLNLESNEIKMEGAMNLLRLNMAEMHWLHLKNQKHVELQSTRSLIVKKYPKLDLRELSL